MSRIINCDPGGEYLIPFAERKVRAFHAEMLRTKVASLYRMIMVDDATRIHISVLAVGHGVFIDKIRITAATGTTACIFNLATYYADAGIVYDPALLDPAQPDYGLLVPPDTVKPLFRGATAEQISAWVAAGSDPAVVPGMHVNYAYEAQYPSDYATLVPTLTPEGLNFGATGVPQTGYLPKISGGTFIVPGSYYHEPELYIQTTDCVITWIQNTGANKNLTIRKSLDTVFEKNEWDPAFSLYLDITYMPQQPVIFANGKVGIAQTYARFDYGVSGYTATRASFELLSPSGPKETKVLIEKSAGGDPEGDGGVVAR